MGSKESSLTRGVDIIFSRNDRTVSDQDVENLVRRRGRDGLDPQPMIPNDSSRKQRLEIHEHHPHLAAKAVPVDQDFSEGVLRSPRWNGIDHCGFLRKEKWIFVRNRSPARTSR